MGWCQGGIIFEGELNELRTQLDNYYGYVGEIDLGVIKPKVVNKPKALISLEQCEAFSALPESGGIEDQSYIWLQTVAVCRYTRDLHAAIRKQNRSLGNL
jgi:hypothetical protein